MADSTCPACLEDYKDPRLLPCSHAVCLSCIVTIQKYGYVPCPVCECEHKISRGGIEDFPVIPDVAELSAKIQVKCNCNLALCGHSIEELTNKCLIGYDTNILSVKCSSTVKPRGFLIYHLR